jgi:hypothetical protein
MEDRIRLTIADGIADVRLNRADKMNALDPAMFRAIAEAGARPLWSKRLTFQNQRRLIIWARLWTLGFTGPLRGPEIPKIS